MTDQPGQALTRAPSSALLRTLLATYATIAIGLVVGGIVAAAVGFGGGSRCTAEGLGCLGWLIYGAAAGLIVGLVVVFVVGWRARLRFLTMSLAVAGALVITVVGTKSHHGGALLWFALLAWPAAAVLATSAGPDRMRWPRVAGVLALIAGLLLGNAWLGEKRVVDARMTQFAKESSTVWGPRDDSDNRYVLAIENVVDDGFSYTFDDGSDFIDVEITRQPGAAPAEGAVEELSGRPGLVTRRGQDVISVHATSAVERGRAAEVERRVITELEAKSTYWLATRQQPMHRWFADR